MSEFLFTSESVSEGHPDKICDQISDAILDEALRKDSNARVACEALASTGMVVIAGEMTTKAYIDFPQIVRQVIRRIGYENSSMGFDWSSCAILSSIEQQSSDIAMGVDVGGAGDQGLMFGYATNETKEIMPQPIMLAHHLMRRVAELRHKKNGQAAYLRPDGKAQITVRYRDNKPVGVETIVLSVQHHNQISENDLKQYLMTNAINVLFDESMRCDNFKVLINPTGRFVLGGPHADCGLTGRKIIVDTYGGFGRHGGGAFSGKDPTKVDRSAAYMARYIAKNLVLAQVCERCEVQLAYAIGIPEPVSIYLNTYGTGRRPENELIDIIRKHIDLTPQGIIKKLNLLNPIYEQTACYGHFGRSEFSWEKDDLVSYFA